MNDTRLNMIALTTMLLAVGSLAGSAQEERRVQTVLFDRAIQPGEVVRLDVTCDCETTGATATVFGQDVPLFPIRNGEAWRGLIGIDLDIKQWRRLFQAPARAPTSGNFGTRSVFNGQPRSPQSGVDFRSKAGTPVAAPATGVVTAAESLYFTGNTLVIDHGLWLCSLLAHLSQFAVKAGDRVRRGQIVGFVGATGRVTGPHLHWSVRLNSARVDPLSLIAAMKESKETSE